MDFDAQWLLWALPLAFALGWLASRLDIRQWKREQRDAPKTFSKGLTLLLNEQHDKAIDAFIEAVQQDPDTTDLHFALGGMFRRRGEYERAVRVHQHLLGRADLPAAERERARHALAQDYMKAGLFDRAEAAYRALETTSFATEARLALLDLHERAREWQAATDVAKQLEASGVGSYASRIAHYACELAAEADAAGMTVDADGHVAAALAIAPQDARPLVVAGERAAASGDAAGAVRHWTALMAARPPAFNLVARRYATVAQTLGDPAAAAERLEAVYARAPGLDVLEAIASLQPAGTGRRERVLEHLREHPTLAAAQALLDERSAGTDGTAATAGATPPGLEPAEAGAVGVAIRRAARPLHRYRCAACGFEAENHFWQCPGCLGWDTYPPQRLEDQ